MSAVLLAVSAAVATLMGTLFLVSIISKRNDIVDIFWGPGIFLVTLVAYVYAPVQTVASELLLVLTGLWGFRLAYRIHRRNRGKEEDFRYRSWRQAWGRWVYVRSFFQIYCLQGSLMLVLGASAIVAALAGGAAAELSVFAYVGVVVWLIGYYFEVIGDMQLDDFIKNRPAGREILDTGLWRYTRHPNYFGEVTMWWGIWLVVAALPLGYLALISPLTITFLILYVSGIPMLERKYADNPAYQAYQERTSAFFPLPSRSKDAIHMQ